MPGKKESPAWMWIGAQQLVSLVPACRVPGRLNLTVRTEEQPVSIVERQRQQEPGHQWFGEIDTRWPDMLTKPAEHDDRAQWYQLSVDERDQTSPLSGVAHSAIRWEDAIQETYNRLRHRGRYTHLKDERDSAGAEKGKYPRATAHEVDLGPLPGNGLRAQRSERDDDQEDHRPQGNECLQRREASGVLGPETVQSKQVWDQPEVWIGGGAEDSQVSCSHFGDRPALRVRHREQRNEPVSARRYRNPQRSPELLAQLGYITPIVAARDFASH